MPCTKEEATRLGIKIQPIKHYKKRRAICHEALEKGFHVIKLQKNAITAKAHPTNRDRSYCGKGIMLVLGPWEIKEYSLPLTAGNSGYKAGNGRSKDKKGATPTDSLHAQFHNLNAMTAELCMDSIRMSIDKSSLKDCK